LRTNHDFDSLRDRPEFKEVEAAVARRGEKRP
jgi:hypothetical protein